jgi:hypothetical protein
MRSVVRAVTLAAVASLVAVLLVACSESSPGVPTTIESSSSFGSTAGASNLTSSDDITDLDASPDGRPPGPPEEAVLACEQKGESDACSFLSLRDGRAMDGTCRARRDDPGQFVCVPGDRAGRGPRGEGPWGPPEEALAACAGAETGTACSFEAPFGTVDGTCHPGPDGSGVVACRPEWDGENRPEGWGPGRGGPRHEEALAACSGKQADATCSFESPFGSVDGTCRTGRDGSSLVCAPEGWPGR